LKERIAPDLGCLALGRQKPAASSDDPCSRLADSISLETGNGIVLSGEPGWGGIRAAALKPFIKWPGGKRWFIEKHYAFLPSHVSGTYIEPFVGGGSVFFALRPPRAQLSDTCADLIATYRGVRNQLENVKRLLDEHSLAHCTDYYYHVRDQQPGLLAERAARFLYLNRTCFNGIYRVNRQGRFNVPIGNRTSISRQDDQFGNWSRALRKAKVLMCDFEDAIDNAVSGDFVFADPPYTVRHNLNGFLKYNEVLFSWDDQLRLHAALLRAKRRGVSILMTNANHESVRTLYLAGFSQSVVSRYSSIAGLAQHRERFDELVVT
jgi:DNA adenine methylase